MKHYTYRTTTDKLAGHLDHITEAGDTILSVQFMGGRDWVIVAKQGANNG